MSGLDRTNSIIEGIRAAGILPSLLAEDTEQIVAVVRAVREEGLCCAEIAFPAGGTAETIRHIRSAAPDMLLGACNIQSTLQADETIAAGVDFISVAPDTEAANHCVESGTPLVAACSSAGEIEKAREKGAGMVKYPADSGDLNEIAAANPGMRFIVTGAANGDRLADYLSRPGVAACGIGPLLGSNPGAAGRLAREAVQAMLAFEVAHIGINCENAEEAKATADFFCRMFGFEYRPTPTAIFTGDRIEVMKSPYFGRLGHIAIRTPQVERAVAYLRTRGVLMNERSAKSDDMGLLAVYFEQEVAGFALHLLRKK